MQAGETIRLEEISDHPRASGFPDNHPDMHSFLGVPISTYGRPIGQIYLANKENEVSFTEHDQRLIEMLAAHASTAIENARLYRQVLESESELSQRNEQLELINNLTSAISSATDVEDMMEVMLTRVVDLFGAFSGEIFLRDREDHAFELAIHCCKREQPIWTQKQFNSEEGFIGKAANRNTLSWKKDLQSELAYLEEGALEMGLGTLVAVPISSRNNVVGVLDLGFFGDRYISDREIGMLEAVGAGVGIGIDNTRLSRQARRMAVLEERERIGMDLHDGIIQSIYAVGLTLDSIRVMIRENPDDAVTHLETAIVSLNANIRDIRSYILDLQPMRMQGSDLKAELSRLSQEFKANSLIDIELHIEDLALQGLGVSESRSLLHITQEALANVAKHANATRVWLSVREIDQYIYLQIIDNGRGFDLTKKPHHIGHGLSNMEERASQINAEFETVSGLGEGTTITVRLSHGSGY
jgi:signal transduction histidine kinase